MSDGLTLRIQLASDLHLEMLEGTCSSRLSSGVLGVLSEAEHPVARSPADPGRRTHRPDGTPRTEVSFQ